MRHLNSYLNTVDILPLKEYCMAVGRLSEYSPGECFQTGGCSVRSFGFLVSGSVRYCCQAADGREFNVGYAFDEAFIGDYSAYLRGAPADMSISVLDKASVWVISGEQLHDFVCSSEENRDLFSNIANDLFIRMQDRLLDFYILSPEERYIKIMRESPYLFTRIALKELASYIGITPEALSRIRKRISKV